MPVLNKQRDLVLGQLSTAWSLLEYHCQDLTTEECLWRPAERGFHVTERSGVWVADWPESESYSNGPPSVAWLTWHVGFWWSMVLDHSFGTATLQREDVVWPGSAEAAVVWLEDLHRQWVDRLQSLSDSDFAAVALARWPISDTPFIDVALWLNLELMKNAAEIGFCRFLHGARQVR